MHAHSQDFHATTRFYCSYLNMYKDRTAHFTAITEKNPFLLLVCVCVSVVDFVDNCDDSGIEKRTSKQMKHH